MPTSSSPPPGFTNAAGMQLLSMLQAPNPEMPVSNRGPSHDTVAKRPPRHADNAHHPRGHAPAKIPDALPAHARPLTGALCSRPELHQDSSQLPTMVSDNSNVAGMHLMAMLGVHSTQTSQPAAPPVSAPVTADPVTASCTSAEANEEEEDGEDIVFSGMQKRHGQQGPVVNQPKAAKGTKALAQVCSVSKTSAPPRPATECAAACAVKDRPGIPKVKLAQVKGSPAELGKSRAALSEEDAQRLRTLRMERQVAKLRRQPKGPDGTTGFLEGRQQAGLPPVALGNPSGSRAEGLLQNEAHHHQHTASHHTDHHPRGAGQRALFGNMSSHRSGNNFVHGASTAATNKGSHSAGHPGRSPLKACGNEPAFRGGGDTGRSWRPALMATT